MYLYYIVLLVLISVLHLVYYKYIGICREYFQITDSDGTIYRNTTSNEKTLAIKKLCALKQYLEESISTKTTNMYVEEKIKSGAEDLDDMISIDFSNTELIGGSYDINDNIIYEYLNKDTKNKCVYKKWNPDVISDKDKIINYLKILQEYFNLQVLKLNKLKITIIAKIDDFSRMLYEELDDVLLGQCATCMNSKPCETVFCADKELSVSEQIEKNTNYILKKQEELEFSFCQYILLYKHVNDVSDGINMYTEKLNTYWKNLNLDDIDVKLNFR